MNDIPKRTKVSPVDDRISGPLFRHVIISCAYRGEPVAVEEFSTAVRGMLEDHDVAIEAAVTYASPYFAMPNRLSIREVWTDMSDQDRQRLFEEFPQVAASINVLLRVNGGQ